MYVVAVKGEGVRQREIGCQLKEQAALSDGCLDALRSVFETLPL